MLLLWMNWGRTKLTVLLSTAVIRNYFIFCENHIFPCSFLLRIILGALTSTMSFGILEINFSCFGPWKNVKDSVKILWNMMKKKGVNLVIAYLVRHAGGSELVGPPRWSRLKCFHNNNFHGPQMINPVDFGKHWLYLYHHQQVDISMLAL